MLFEGEKEKGVRKSLQNPQLRGENAMASQIHSTKNAAAPRKPS